MDEKFSVPVLREAFEHADRAVQDSPFHGLEPEEAARRAEKDHKAAVELLRLSKKLPPVKIAFIPLFAGVPVLIAAFFVPWKTAFVGVGSILILLFAVMYPRLQGLARTKRETLETREKILRAYGADDPEGIPAALAEYRRLWLERDHAKLRLDDALAMHPDA